MGIALRLLNLIFSLQICYFDPYPRRCWLFEITVQTLGGSGAYASLISLTKRGEFKLIAFGKF